MIRFADTHFCCIWCSCIVRTDESFGFWMSRFSWFWHDRGYLDCRTHVCHKHVCMCRLFSCFVLSSIFLSEGEPLGVLQTIYLSCITDCNTVCAEMSCRSYQSCFGFATEIKIVNKRGLWEATGAGNTRLRPSSTISADHRHYLNLN